MWLEIERWTIVDIFFIPAWIIDEVGCPIFSNEEIVQQPADFLNLTNAYIANAVEAIKKATGNDVANGT